VSQKILPLLPTPTNGNITNNFLTIGAHTFDRNQYDFKIDHNFTDNNRLSIFTYINRENNIDPLLLPNPLSSALNQSRPALWIRLNHDYIFSPSTLNHFTAALTREPQIWQKLSADQDWPTKLGLSGVNTGYGNAFPLITFSNGFATLADQTKTDGQQVVEKSDFRKYDDGLRMILDCTAELAAALTQRLAAAAFAGVVRFGLHRQDAAMMTCFTPSPLRSDHVHFIDGARGGYASAATA